MKLTFLGTGTSQGIPMIANDDPVCFSKNPKDNRLRTSVLISWNNFNVVIDTGPDFRQQMLREQVKFVNCVLYTHEHADHTAGMDDLRPFCYLCGEMPIYAQKRVLNNLKVRFDYIFATENRYEGAPKVKPHQVVGTPFELNDVKITPIEVMHGKLPILGYRFNDLAYFTDVKTISEQEKQKLKNLEVLVINALRIEKHPTHLNLEEALDLVEELKPKRTYFNHISHKLGFHNDVKKLLPKNVFLSYDGLQIEI